MVRHRFRKDNGQIAVFRSFLHGHFPGIQGFTGVFIQQLIENSACFLRCKLNEQDVVFHAGALKGILQGAFHFTGNAPFFCIQVCLVKVVHVEDGTGTVLECIFRNVRKGYGQIDILKGGVGKSPAPYGYRSLRNGNCRKACISQEGFRMNRLKT